nr:MAG TPA: hypothetical protein [Caudoviricetes sp.]
MLMHSPLSETTRGQDFRPHPLVYIASNEVT